MLSIPDFKEKSLLICYSDEGQKVSFKNDNLLISKEDEVMVQLSCHKIFALWIIGHATLTSGLLERSKKFGFPIVMFSYSFRPYGIWNSPVEGNFLLRKKQYEYDAIDIARKLVKNKIHNQLLLLKSIRTKSKETKHTIELIEKYHIQTDEAEDLQGLLGIEGVSTRLFFATWFSDIGWIGRRPRTKCDCINTCLDIGYTLLFYFIETMLNLYGFDVYQGVYHRNFYQRKSLVCDLVEPFRCIIDHRVKKAFHLQQIKSDDFIEVKGQYLLKKEKSRAYVRFLMESILEHKIEIFSYIQSYYRYFLRSKSDELFPQFILKK
ncbi:MAG: type V CRISPR-associated endonuclease Cas1 [Bacteroidales bacterium]|nr:type V CRISPR-associated endonuclease Cas1 [Bacteroidales bacterium]